MLDDPQTPRPTLGILFPGELGSMLGRVLAQHGFRVVTTLKGRSTRTRRLCEEAGLHVLGSLDEVADAADLVFSVVPPAAALAVAELYCTHRHSSRSVVYVDVNSISPEMVGEIGARLERAGVDFVDAAVHGMAAQLTSRGTLYLSGASARRLAELLGKALRVRVIGDAPGRASAFKMMVSGLPKGVVALFLEMSLFARRAGLLNELLACYREAYPGIMALVDRLLPTYPQHAERRGHELREVERTMTALGLEPCMMAGARHLTTEVGGLELAKHAGEPDWSVLDVIEAVYAHNPLALLTPAGSAGDPNLPD